MAFGTQAQLGIDMSAPVAHGYEFARCGLSWRGNLLDVGGMRGSRSHLAADACIGPSLAAGTIDLVPSYADLSSLLPWILGKDATGSSYDVGESVSERVVTVDKVARVYTYTGCYVRRAAFMAGAGKPLTLGLDILGRGEIETASGSFPSVDYIEGHPLMFSESTLTVMGQPLLISSFKLSIDNPLSAVFSGSATATSMFAVNRTVRFACVCPVGDASLSIRDMPLVGAAASLVVGQAGESVTMTMPALQAAPAGPEIPGREEVELRFEGVARRTPELSELQFIL